MAGVTAVELSCAELPVRELNAVLRGLPDGTAVRITEPRGRHNLAVGLTGRLDITIAGNAGDDIIDGGTGADTMLGGQDFDELKKQAATRDFKPVPLGATASMTIANKLRTINSRNVIAKLEGSDPALKDEYVVYTAHWDHFGKSADGIFHGAEDDGLGCAALIEMARTFTKLPTPPRRSSGTRTASTRSPPSTAPRPAAVPPGACSGACCSACCSSSRCSGWPSAACS